MKISSSAFEHNKKIPEKYAYEKENVSPPLKFADVPPETKTLALIVDDPDAPHGNWDHWIVWNIDGKTRELAEGAVVPFQGMNDYKEVKYGGPCPPPGKPHRYFFKLFALDKVLDLPNGAKKKIVEKAMEGHILAKAELIGLYQQ